eukprot:2224051-Rhodomonas_salina.1
MEAKRGTARASWMQPLTSVQQVLVMLCRTPAHVTQPHHPRHHHHHRCPKEHTALLPRAGKKTPSGIVRAHLWAVAVDDVAEA